MVPTDNCHATVDMLTQERTESLGIVGRMYMVDDIAIVTAVPICRIITALSTNPLL